MTDTTSAGTADDIARAEARLGFARAALGDAHATLERASVDAGFRSYWRSSGEPTRIVMDAPPGKEDVRPWLAIRDLLEAGGVRVPRVLARDVDSGTSARRRCCRSSTSRTRRTGSMRRSTSSSRFRESPRRPTSRATTNRCSHAS